MNLFFKIFLIFCNFNIFCGCCNYNNKTEKNNEINDDDKEINNDNNDDKPPAYDDKDKKPPVDNKNRRPSYFKWDNDCAVQVFAMTFFIIFRDNPEGLKLLEDSNILFFQKIAKMCKDYYNFKKKGIKKSNTTEELHEVYKEYGRFLINESLKIADKILTIFNNNDSNFDTLNKIYLGLIDKCDENLININKTIESYIMEFRKYINIINYLEGYNLNKAKSYKMNFKVPRFKEETDEEYNRKIKRHNTFIEDLNFLQDDLSYHREFFKYYKNDFTKDFLETIKNIKSYGFSFHISDITYLLKKYIPNIKNNEKFKNLDIDNYKKDINENTIFIHLRCCLGANLNIKEILYANHSNCIYKDIDGNYWYAYGYDEEFLIDKNLIKQKKFKEIVDNNFGGQHYTLHSVDDFINVKN